MAKINKPMSEHMEQVHLFAWIKKHTMKYPILDLIFAIPNGGHRHPAVAAKMVAEGVKRGVPDICIPIPSQKYHGAWIELKAISTTSRTSSHQVKKIKQLNDQGYLAVVIDGHIEAIKFLKWYLNIKIC